MWYLTRGVLQGDGRGHRKGRRERGRGDQGGFIEAAEMCGECRGKQAASSWASSGECCDKCVKCDKCEDNKGKGAPSLML